MATPTPLSLISQFAEAMARGDLQGLLALYEPGASLVDRSGVPATGPRLREALAAFASLRPSLVHQSQMVVEAGDVALYCSGWTLSGIDAQGEPVEMAGRAADILRRQADGNWLLAVDNPWGTEVLTPLAR